MSGEPQLRTSALARELLRRERREGESDSAAGACRAVFDRLYGELETLIGRGAFHALLIRALALAGKSHRCLRRIDARHVSAPGLDHLEQHLRHVEPADPEAATSDLVTEFLELLVRILGPELTRAIVRAGWPDVMHPGRGTTDGGENDG